MNQSTDFRAFRGFGDIDCTGSNMQEMEKIIENYKENTVQSILCRSVEEEIKERSECPDCFHNSILFGNISELTENLILTSASNLNPQTLEVFNPSCIISCTPELPDPPLREDIVYHKINVVDSGNSRISQYFDEAADLIQQISSLGGKTIVYCVAGVSRSASICIAYLIKYKKFSLLEAYNYVKLRRPKIKPNCGFFKQLIDYEKQLNGCNTVHMVYNDCVQMEIPDVYDNDYKVITNFGKKRTGRR